MKCFDGLSSDDQFFVGRYNPKLNTALTIVDPSFRCISKAIFGRVERDSELLQIFADTSSDTIAVFTDTTGEDNGIRTTERDQHTTQVSSNFLPQKHPGLTWHLHSGVRCIFEIADISADSIADTEKSGLIREET